MAVMTQLLLAALSPYLALSAYLDVGIVNGTEAKPYSRPYMVSVQKDGQHICGGFLVSEHFVMTAAHCWKGEKKLTVVLGAHDLSKKDPALVHMAVKFYHVHPMYNSNTLSGDIMLLQLNKKAKKSKRVNWISIPKKEAAVKAKACSVAGWGRQADKGPVSVCLLEANVSVLDKKICQQWTRPSSSMLCAGGPEGFCQMRAMHRLLLAAALSSLAYNATYGGSIIHGVKAKKNTLQFMASVQLNRKHICGGFVIDSRHVLTAAHCNKSGNMSVVLGAKNIKALGENLQRYTVKKSYIYPSYDNPKTGGDIMLLKLSKTIARNKNVKIIQTPSKDKQVKANTKCLIAGWGKTETQNTVDDLRMTDVRTVDLKLCQKKWRDMNVELPAAALCAGGYKTKSGACQGDSGGPLVCNNVAVGIISFNFKQNCDYPNLPNVYTEISKYRDWIKKIIGQRV
ncbi:hypothetical protein P4O66_012985 [Electrophorus voltai]|uniref:trypsin n=1 Tax=Electrophorus voltai TaxID=2609070 RepID=A0AAD9E680_9TELE|nr:hypothetical protein P4O66_012985 [Electrophorus voltai]